MEISERKIKGRILLAEDNDNIRKLLVKLLSTNGYDVTPVDNGLEARKQLIGESFDMVLSDILMPGVDGIELLKEVKTNFGDIPVVLITGNQSLDNAKEAIHWGAFDYITKPFSDLSIVLHSVFRAVSKNLLQKEKENLISELDRKNLHLKSVVRELDKKNARLDLMVYDLEWAMKLSHIITSEINIDDMIDQMSKGIYEIFNVWAWGVLLYCEDQTRIKIIKTGSVLDSLDKSLFQMLVRDFYSNTKISLKSDKVSIDIKENLLNSTELMPNQAQFKTAPLSTGGRSHGSIFIYGDIKSGFEKSKEHTLSLIAGQLSASLENARLIEELKNRNKTLKELSDFKDDVLGIAAHDLRSPLSAIQMSATLLQNYANKMDENEKQEVLDGIAAKVKHMIKMLGELLDISVIESGNLVLKKKYAAFSDLLMEHYKQVIPHARSKTIDIKIDIPENLPKTEFDARKMGEVLDNLLTNAIKYTPAGGNVFVQAKKSDGFIEVCVQDTGVGIRESEIQKLFKKFSRTSSKPTGGESSTGLGLAIAKKIVDLHEGNIWAESTYGEGSRFYFTLPIIDSRENKPDNSTQKELQEA